MVALQAAALAFSLLHLVVGARAGTYGTGDTVTPAQAGMLVSVALVYAWWSLLLAFLARRDALWALAALAGLWSGVGNGAAALASCFVPCALPLNDLSHLGSLVFGVWAALVTSSAARRAAGPAGWGPLAITLVLMVASSTLQAASVSIR